MSGVDESILLKKVKTILRNLDGLPKEYYDGDLKKMERQKLEDERAKYMLRTLIKTAKQAFGDEEDTKEDYTKVLSKKNKTSKYTLENAVEEIMDMLKPEVVGRLNSNIKEGIKKGHRINLKASMLPSSVEGGRRTRGKLRAKSRAKSRKKRRRKGGGPRKNAGPEKPIVGYYYRINIYWPVTSTGPQLRYGKVIGKYMGPASEIFDGWVDGTEGPQYVFKTRVLDDDEGVDEFIGEIISIIGPSTTYINGGRRKKRTRKRRKSRRKSKGRKRRKSRRKRGGVVVKGRWVDIDLNDIKLGETYRVTTTSYRQIIPSPFIGTYKGVRQNSSMQNIFTFSTDTFSHTVLGERDIPIPERTIQRVEQYNIAPNGVEVLEDNIKSFVGGRRKNLKKRTKRRR